jgi:hypothetical protein
MVVTGTGVALAAGRVTPGAGVVVGAPTVGSIQPGNSSAVARVTNSVFAGLAFFPNIVYPSSAFWYLLIADGWLLTTGTWPLAAELR